MFIAVFVASLCCEGGCYIVFVKGVCGKLLVLGGGGSRLC